MAFLRKVLLVLAILIAVLFAASFFLPKEAEVERSTVIDVKKEVLFDYLNSMKNFNDWSPWFEMDPNGKYEFSGPEYGVGSKFSWESDKTGIGTQEIIASNPYNDITLKLVFDGQPPSEASYHLSTDGDKTKMTWKFKTGLNGPMEKYLGLMMDSFIGDMYEKGLANLKSKAESLPKEVLVAKSTENQSNEVIDMFEPELIEVEPYNIAYIANRADFDKDKISQALTESYGKVVGHMMQNGIGFAGSPLAITTAGSPEEGFWAFEAAIPVDKTLESKDGDEIKFKQTYGGRVVKLVHKGDYMSMPSSYKKLAEYVYGNNLEPNGDIWEQYISDPGNTPQDELITHLFFPVK